MNENLVRVKIGNKVVSRRLYNLHSDANGALVGKVRTGWGKMTQVSKSGRQKVFHLIAS